MNVLLMGLRAVGKSTIGPPLAQRLQFAFVEHDDLVAASLRTPHAGQAIRVHGLTAFREAESRVLHQVLEGDRQVISLGGGTPTAPGASELLLEHRQSGRARIIYLQADLEVLKARLSRPEAPDRPSLTGGTNAAAELHEIATVREPLYERLADITIQVSGRSPSDVVQAALDQLARPGMRPG